MRNINLMLRYKKINCWPYQCEVLKISTPPRVYSYSCD